MFRLNRSNSEICEISKSFSKHIDKTEIPGCSKLIGKKTVIVMIGLPVYLGYNILICIGSWKKLYCENASQVFKLGWL